MKRNALLAAALLALPVASHTEEAPTLEAAASDLAATLQGARKAAGAQELSVQTKAITGIFVHQDCKKFTFSETSPALSEPLDFRSETWLEECDNIPLPTPPGGGVCIPRRSLLKTDLRTVRVEVLGRNVPGPKEVFQVCLWGSSLSLKVKESPNRYNVSERQEPVFNSTLVLTKK